MFYFSWMCVCVHVSVHTCMKFYTFSRPWYPHWRWASVSQRTIHKCGGDPFHLPHRTRHAQPWKLMMLEHCRGTGKMGSLSHGKMAETSCVYCEDTTILLFWISQTWTFIDLWDMFLTQAWLRCWLSVLCCNCWLYGRCSPHHCSSAAQRSSWNTYRIFYEEHWHCVCPSFSLYPYIQGMVCVCVIISWMSSCQMQILVRPTLTCVIDVIMVCTVELGNDPHWPLLPSIPSTNQIYRKLQQ